MPSTDIAPVTGLYMSLLAELGVLRLGQSATDISLLKELGFHVGRLFYRHFAPSGAMKAPIDMPATDISLRSNESSARSGTSVAGMSTRTPQLR